MCSYRSISWGDLSDEGGHQHPHEEQGHDHLFEAEVEPLDDIGGDGLFDNIRGAMQVFDIPFVM